MLGRGLLVGQFALLGKSGHLCTGTPISYSLVSLIS